MANLHARKLANLLDETGKRCEGDLKDAVVDISRLLRRYFKDADADADAVPVQDIDVNLKREFIALFYDIEDAVESYTREEAAASKRKLCEVSCISNRLPVRKLREDLEIFRRRMDKIEDDARESGLRYASENRASLRHMSPARQQPFDTSSFYQRFADTKKLKSWLLEGEPGCLVVAIYGMGGIGKTTLAEFLFEDGEVKSHFRDALLWASVGVEPQHCDILKSLLSQSGSDLISTDNEDQLMTDLNEFLKERTYLVVLDDVWSSKIWHQYLKDVVCPLDNKGSRIIITTRSYSVADHASSSRTEFQHEVKPLNEEESWELFKMISPIRDLPDITPEPDNIGWKITRLCGGLPLAITLSSSHLMQHNFEDWGEVLPSLQEVLDLKIAQVTMAKSYDRLPFDLKLCFLYLGLFPPNHTIPFEKLYLLWMAEGLIWTHDRRKIAKGYFTELALQSVVMEVKNEEESARYHWFKSCKVHVLMRRLCIFKGKEEEFLEVIGLVHGKRESPLARKIAIYLDESEYFNDDLLMIPAAKHIRSILFFEADKSLPKPIWPRKFSDLNHFPKTKVLDFDGVHFGVRKLPRGIENLIYLTYLSFQGCYLKDFPSSFSNFPYLETLDLRVRVSCVMNMPSDVLRKLSNLRHLFLPLAYKTDTNAKLKLETLKKLEILENFHAGVCDAEDLLQLEKLEAITVIVDGDNMELEKTISTFSRMKFKIRCSSLVVKRFDSYSEKRFSHVEDLVRCKRFHVLEIEGYLGMLPCPEGIVGCNFNRMVFNGSEFSEDPMPILGKLANLRSLVFCDDAFEGKKMVCFEGAFPKLQSIKLTALRSLEEWEVKTGAMKGLPILTIERCNNLAFPAGLMELPDLEELKIGSMPERFQKKAKEMDGNIRDWVKTAVTFYKC